MFNSLMVDNSRTKVLAGKAGLVLRELENRFVTGKYRFGDAISINKLANEFNASRQPVTTAVNHLRSMGYVDIIPQVGCRVVSPDKREVADFFYMLGKAEGAVAGMAANRWREGDIEELKKIESIISTTDFDTIDHKVAFASAVDAFHEKIHSIAVSPSSTYWLHSLWRLADFYLWQGADINFSQKRIDVANRERRVIIRALKQRDVRLIESLMEEHVNGKAQRVGVV